MLVRRYLGTASLVCALAIGVSSPALAAEDVSVNNTGPDSVQKVEIDNTVEAEESNTNEVKVTNVNVQEATTGDVKAEKNTTVGDLSSGDASNVNSTTTDIGVSNNGTSEVPAGGSGTGSTATPGGSGGQPAGGMGGSTLGASTTGGSGGVATLPEVGASQFVDVSALRAAWQPQTATPTAPLAKSSQMFTGAMLLTATLLSLLGAIGSALYARRKEERI